MLLRGGGHRRDCEHQSHHDSGVAEREEKSHRDRTPALLHQLAGDVVDRRDVVGIEGVPQPEAIGKEGRAKQKRILMECRDRPQPDADIGRHQERVEAGELAARAFRRVVENVRKHACAPSRSIQSLPRTWSGVETGFGRDHAQTNKLEVIRFN